MTDCKFPADYKSEQKFENRSVFDEVMPTILLVHFLDTVCY